MVALDITTGLRRDELEAVRWEDLNESDGYIQVKEHHYRGHIDHPKTEAGFRNAPVPTPSLGASSGLEEHIEAHEANRLHLRDSKRKAGKRQQHSSTTRVPCLRRRQDSASQLADFSTHLFQLVASTGHPRQRHRRDNGTLRSRNAVHI